MSKYPYPEEMAPGIPFPEDFQDAWDSTADEHKGDVEIFVDIVRWAYAEGAKQGHPNAKGHPLYAEWMRWEDE